jgi:epoxide hydrolase-like predicted phosphatase
VLTTPITESFGRFVAETGVSPERFRRVVAEAYASPDITGPARSDEIERRRRRGLVADLETGRIPVEEFDGFLAEALSDGLARPVAPDGLARRLFAGLEPDDAMVTAARTARELGFATAIVSNTWGEAPAVADLRATFDAVILSHEEGCRKPERRIYLLAAARLGVGPEECVFVDDIPVNVEGAKSVGMTGVLHRHAEVTIPRLEKLLGASLSRP